MCMLQVMIMELREVQDNPVKGRQDEIGLD